MNLLSHFFFQDFHLGDYTSTCTSSHSCSVCVCSGSVVSHSPCFTPHLYYFKYTLLLLSLYWTCCVLSNILHVTTARAVAHWWFHGVPNLKGMSYHTPLSTSSQIVKDSFLFTLTRLIGSIAFGSLAVAIIRTLRSVVYLLVNLMGHGSGIGGMGVEITPPSVSIGGKIHLPKFSTTRRHEDQRTTSRLKKFMVECLLSLLNVLDRMVTYFNHYAFCYVATSDLSFMDASRYCWYPLLVLIFALGLL
jgi:hypothetical protein